MSTVSVLHIVCPCACLILTKIHILGAWQNSEMKMKKEEADVSPGHYPTNVESKAGSSVSRNIKINS